jgi:hypothetical protein
MTTALVSHLVRQGEYSKSDIAVLTPYLGQLQRLRRRMEFAGTNCPGFSFEQGRLRGDPKLAGKYWPT